ncbi:MAG: NAD-dependent epimerase/dehydratase family protein [Flavobacteriaceae bacterium]
MKNIMITGGSGFIGLHLIDLLLDQGYNVNVLYRSSKELEIKEQENNNLKLFKGSLNDKPSILKAAQGCDGIIHVAGIAKQWSKDPELFEKVNVDGSRLVFQCAKELGIKRVVNTSTAGTIPPSTDLPSTEATPRNIDYFFEYEASKAKAELVAKEFCSEDLEIITVNPCRVYGPGEIGQSNSTVLMMDKYLKGKWKFIPGSGEQYGSFVYVEDVALGMLLALQKGKSGERYILGGENANYNQFFDKLRDISKVHYKIYHMPLAVISLMAKASGFLANTFKVEPLMMPGVARKLYFDWKVDTTKAEKHLGYSHRSLDQGLRDTYAWLNQS